MKPIPIVLLINFTIALVLYLGIGFLIDKAHWLPVFYLIGFLTNLSLCGVFAISGERKMTIAFFIGALFLLAIGTPVFLYYYMNTPWVYDLFASNTSLISFSVGFSA